MGDHRHAPAPRYPSRLWLGLMAAAVTGIVAGTVGAAHEIAPKVAADEHLALTPERSAEPVAHGGPLAMPSIGVVATGTVEGVVPTTARTTTRPAQRPQEARRTVRGSTASHPTVSGAPSPTPAAGTTTTVPTVTTPTQAATVTTGAATTTAEATPTITEATTSSETTTSETATVSVTVTATESTEEGQ